MDTIVIADLEVFFRVGVPDEERSAPQRLLVTLELEHSFSDAATGDSLSETIDYDALCRRLAEWGGERSWRLIETLACEMAEWILSEFRPAAVTVEIKKFILPQTRHVAVRVSRPRVTSPNL